jgi:hypothetical protein
VPSQFQLRGHSMEGLRWQLFESYGPAARIIRAERIQTGGLFGIGATTTYEVVVEVDADPALHKAANDRVGSFGVASVRRSGASRRNLRDLLAEADRADDARPSGAVRAIDAKPDFDAILGKMVREDADDTGASVTGADKEEESAGPRVKATPRPSTTPGDLIILAGMRDQPLYTAWSMISQLQDGAELLTAGDHRYNGVSHVFLDSVEVKKAQTLAAGGGRPLLIAFSFGQRGASKLSMLASVRPNQLWLVVDAAHKPEDTASWVRRACRYSVPDALAVQGTTDTATPESVNALKVPVGWVDGHQSTSSEL